MRTTGVEFRAIREARGLTVDGIASATRIPVRYIEALDRDDLRALPARPYLRGFVAAYGRELGLDPAEAVSRYFAHLGPPPPEPVMAAAVALDEPGYSRTWGIAVLVLAVLLAIPAFNNGDRPSSRRNPRLQARPGRCQPRQPPPGTAAAVPEPTDQGAVVPNPGDLRRLDDLRASVLAHRFDGRHTNRLQDDGTRLDAGVEGEPEIAIRVGDAGAVAWTVNGRAQAPLGGPGKVRNVVLTPGSAPAIK